MSETLTGNNVYYPLAVGNRWNYKMKDGATYYSYVTQVSPTNPSEFSMISSSGNISVLVRKEGHSYLTNSYDASKMIVFLKDDLRKGDVFEIHYVANGISTMLIITVKDLGITREVLGKQYSDVLFIEGESKMNINGNLMSMNYFTQYYYAKGIGLIETTTSMGDLHQLESYELK